MLEARPPYIHQDARLAAAYSRPRQLLPLRRQPGGQKRNPFNSNNKAQLRNLVT